MKFTKQDYLFDKLAGNLKMVIIGQYYGKPCRVTNEAVNVRLFTFHDKHIQEFLKLEEENFKEWKARKQKEQNGNS